MRIPWKLVVIVFTVTIIIGLLIDNLVSGLSEDLLYTVFMFVNAVVISIAVIIYSKLNENK